PVPVVPPTAASAPPEVSPTDLPLAPPSPTHPAAAPHPASPRHPPSAGCDPPYTIDANGYRKYKRECASL
ncbi:MAG: hypothetical protein ACRELB_01940, partial [Polyangiaceae bacterium]